MRVALVQCPSWSTLTPPYNLALLAACLKQNNHETRCFDFNIQVYKYIAEAEGSCAWGTRGESNLWLNKEYVSGFIAQHSGYFDSLVTQLLSFNPDVIGLSLQDTTRHFSGELIRRIKAANRSVKIVVGGHSCFGNPAHLGFLENNDIDALCLKEGEFSFVELLALFTDRGDFSYCPGFICRDRNGNIFSANELPLLRNLDSLPFADYSTFKLEDYPEGLLPISTSRGCIFRCAFCAESVSWERYRFRSAGNIFTEMKHQIVKYPALKGFFFNDSLINGNIGMLDELCGLIIADGLSISWGGQGAIRREMDLGLLEKMKKAGFAHISYGLEHGSQRILKMMRKSFSLDAAEELIRNTSKLGIRVSVNIVIGFPGETEDDISATEDFLKRNIDFINDVFFHSLVVLPNTALSSRKDEYGIELSGANSASSWFTKDGMNNYEIRLKRIDFLKQAVKEKYASNIAEFNHYLSLAEDFYDKKDLQRALVYFLKAKDQIKESTDINKVSLVNNRLSAIGYPVKND